MPAPKGNKFALGLTTNGRPPTYASVEDITVKINEYFESCLHEDDPEGDKGYKTRPTVTGLALYLGFCSRKTFYNYSEKKDFLHIIKRAQATIEMSYEECLLSKASTGAIFALKNMGWQDKSEVETTNKNIDIPVSEWVDGTTKGSKSMENFDPNEKD